LVSNLNQAQGNYPKEDNLKAQQAICFWTIHKHNKLYSIKLI
jgi:hypothetical protein